GGNAAFAFEVTDVLTTGKNEVVVRVFDDTRSGQQPTGKQAHGVSEGCVYTRTTGVWQPVWLEAVGQAYIEQFSIVPDPEQSRILIEVAVNGTVPGMTVTAKALIDGKSVGAETVKAVWRDNRLVVNLSEKRLWMPKTPFLYDLELTLQDGTKPIDKVQSYFGLRSVKIDGRAVLINGQRIFQRLILDQGFYPDGIWTAPTDDELKKDIERSMAAGYNGARLHQKVFEPRFLYWADKLGYLVWGEYPNWGYNYKPEGYAAYVDEWVELLVRDRNHPAIVGWCPFNETPSEAGEIQQTVFYLTKAVDPTRPLLETSGWSHTMAHPEMRDIHDYNQDPESFKKQWLAFFQNNLLEMPTRYSGGSRNADLGIPFMISEFGGIGWNINGGWGYGTGPKSLDEFYTRYAGLVAALLDNPDMFGFCYTQLTDIEQEQNGLYYYDRKPKFDMAKLHEATSREAAYEKTGPSAGHAKARKQDWQVLVGAAADGDKCKDYHYTTEQPADGWITASFNDQAWKTGRAPFGNDLPGVRTSWQTGDIWLRQIFDVKNKDIKTAALVIFYDEDTEVFVNGQKIWSHTGFATGYQIFDVTEAMKKALAAGQNTLAVHTHQTGGGQYIDMALLVE
ncbi:MAG: glycoside hydrolase family 2 TIM barrel-domain containing protein, partial [Anaerohalosphaeraceae bacterium]